MGSGEPRWADTSALLLLSAGIDSTTLLALTVAQGFRVKTLTFDYGQPNASRELEVAERNAKKYGSIHHENLKIPGELFGDGPYYPGRNLVFLSMAASYAERHKISRIFIGFVSGLPTPDGGYPDCTLAFANQVEDTVFAGSRAEIEIDAPLVSVVKPGVFSLAKALGVDPSDTFSCLVSENCGDCPSCVERNAALTNKVPRHWQ